MGWGRLEEAGETAEATGHTLKSTHGLA